MFSQASANRGVFHAPVGPMGQTWHASHPRARTIQRSGAATPGPRRGFVQPPPTIDLQGASPLPSGDQLDTQLAELEALNATRQKQERYLELMRLTSGASVPAPSIAQVNERAVC